MLNKPYWHTSSDDNRRRDKNGKTLSNQLMRLLGWNIVSTQEVFGKGDNLYAKNGKQLRVESEDRNLRDWCRILDGHYDTIKIYERKLKTESEWSLCIATCYAKQNYAFVTDLKTIMNSRIGYQRCVNYGELEPSYFVDVSGWNKYDLSTGKRIDGNNVVVHDLLEG